jgi:energy-coupling factor transporter ATP-binding protein EcfA2
VVLDTCLPGRYRQAVCADAANVIDKQRPEAQAGLVTYELHTLGWKAFQDLCVTIAGEVWGQVIQSFFDSRDGGRDGAFQGTWTSKQGETYTGSFTVQCKFTSTPNKTLRLADLRDELSKAKRLASRALADNYFLFTNARVTGQADEKIKAAFEGIPGVVRFASYGGDRISQMIRESPRLRMLVPRVYGIGDLGQILDERACAQAREILSALGDDLAKFVITDAYRRSAKALVEHGFVLLLGEPACGKSTIAAALSVGALDEWGCSTIKVRDAEDFVAHSNPHEPKQFFWVDDAFGATQLDWQGALSWNRVFPHLHAAIRRGARFVFTSRDYIYRAARNYLKESALPVLRESQVVIRVEQLSKEEREQILYNHVRLGTQTGDFKRSLKPYLPAVAANKRFSPEIARRLGNPAFTKRVTVSTLGLEQFVAQPMELLQEIIRTLDANSRSAIALVFMRGGALPSPVELTPEEGHAVVLLGGSEAEVRNSLVSLDGSLLMQVREGGVFSWRFKHPTIRDAFAALVSENRELMDIYLAGTPVERIFREVACGAVSLEGVKVIVPADRYEVLVSRISAFLSDRRENRDLVNRFLANRCDGEFLAKFASRNPSFITSLHVGSYLYAVSDVDVIVRLRLVDLLPEEERVRHVARIRDLAVQTPDAGFLRDDVRGLLSPMEFDDILAYVRANLLPNLAEHVDDWRSSHDGNDDPEDHFSELTGALKEYRTIFEEDAEAVSAIDSALSEIEEAIEGLRSEMPDEPDRDEYYGGEAQGGAGGERSIFDDVDT